VRAQTAVVVVFATLVEYVFSGWLEVYVYRLDHVAPYVPPGHGLVYLAALGFTRSAWLRAHARGAVTATVAVALGYAAWGLWLAPRADVLGAFWCLCLLGFLRWGRDRLLYVGALVVVTWLELPARRGACGRGCRSTPSPAGEHRQPAEHRGGRLRLVRPRRRGRRTGGRARLGPAAAAVAASSDGDPSSESTSSWSRPLVETPLP
jgi:hypothetical protein